jgi:formamidopyrimidine-DNA glycosylase
VPELPEVETTRRGLEPHLSNRQVQAVILRNRSLRWPVPETLAEHIAGFSVVGIIRRGKYLLIAFPHGHLLIHLGMSGSLRIVSRELPANKHDHVDIVFDEDVVLRFNDPRRFGSILWVEGDYRQHPRLRNLGPEPLGTDFTGQYMYDIAHGRNLPIKSFLMDSRIVVGVGNIYANESLFISGIHPLRKSGRISLIRYQRLSRAVVKVLQLAIKQGGTTLRDFVQIDGTPGYFKQQLFVYGRAGLPCERCGNILKEVRVNQRSTVYCLKCQH